MSRTKSGPEGSCSGCIHCFPVESFLLLFDWMEENGKTASLSAGGLVSSLKIPGQSRLFQFFPADFLCCWTIFQWRTRSPPLPMCSCGSFFRFSTVCGRFHPCNLGLDQSAEVQTKRVRWERTFVTSYIFCFCVACFSVCRQPTVM